MITEQTVLDVADNTGARAVRCFKVLGGSRRRYAGVGDVVVGSVIKVLPGSDVQRGEVVRGVIVRTKAIRPERHCVAAAGRQSERNQDLRRHSARAALQELHAHHQPGGRSGLSAGQSP